MMEGDRVCSPIRSTHLQSKWDLASEERKRNASWQRQVLFATLAVVCTRRLVPFAHATEPWATGILFDFIAFRIVVFWLLIVRA